MMLAAPPPLAAAGAGDATLLRPATGLSLAASPCQKASSSKSAAACSHVLATAARPAAEQARLALTCAARAALVGLCFDACLRLQQRRRSRGRKVRRHAVDPVQLTKNIVNASSASAVMQSLEPALEDEALNAIHVSAALHRIAVQRRSLNGHLATSPEMQVLLDRTGEMAVAGKLDARGISKVFYAVGLLERSLSLPSSFLPDLAMAATAKLNDMNAIELSNVLGSVAKLKGGVGDVGGMLPALRKRLTEQAHRMNVKDVASNFWALAHMSSTAAETEELLGALANRTVELADDLDARAVSQILWSLATMRPAPASYGPLVSPLLRAVTACAERMNAQDVSNTLWAVATLRADLPWLTKGVLAAVAPKAASQAERSNGQGLCNMLWACAVIAKDVGEVPEELLAALVAAVPRTLSGTSNPQSVSTAIWSLGILAKTAPEQSLELLQTSVPELEEALLQEKLWLSMQRPVDFTMLLHGLGSLRGAGVEATRLMPSVLRRSQKVLERRMRTREALDTIPQIACSLQQLGAFSGALARTIASKLLKLPLAQLEDWELCFCLAAFQEEEQRLFQERMRLKREARREGRNFDEQKGVSYVVLLKTLNEEVDFRRIAKEKVMASLQGPEAWRTADATSLEAKKE
eukprot:TRINITY_DN100807_c0_g1_i1.p1 TRINITY_DN100807_c0_g1~~TRINITY_DN100807_c0_g1_i1.p1  ORF type:complete len:639 (+),score=187.39 TRINITY_DN100807_c0_g1_i1:161-2077(+)